MDTHQIDDFFSYQPYFQEKPQEIVDDIIQAAQPYLPADDIPYIQKAYEFAQQAHGNIQRLSGEPYIVHPLKATQFLMQIKPDIASIQACILHDVIEDTPISYEDIKKNFGQEVADICEGLVKVSKIRYQGEDRTLETLKKTFLAMAKDLRVIFIKLADRIHNIQTLHFHPKPEKRIRIATETMKIYVPIAKRLGLYQYQLYLENGAFKVLHEKEFNRIVSYIKKNFGVGEKYTARGIKLLTTLLKKEGMTDFVVKGRLKSPYRVYEKLENKYNSSDVSNVMDLLAFRVITNTIADAYLILGIIHKHYTPMIHKIKDYIALPKVNGYKSIHTTVLGMFRFPTEIQIRTFEMDEIAEYGVAAHFGYMEQRGSTKIPKQQVARIKKLQEVVDAYQSTNQKESFKHKLNIEVLNKSVFLYTPKGDIIEVPVGSSVLDFAFHVHTDIGLRFKNALVNREIKPISYVPQTGDVVMINTFKNKTSATRHWMEFLHTPSAKAKLARHLRQQQKEQLVEKATRTLNTHLEKYKLPSVHHADDKITKHFSSKNLERKLLNIVDKKENYSQLIKEVYPQQWKEQQKQKQLPVIKKTTQQATVIVDSDKLVTYQLCKECTPSYGEKIIAKTGRNGLKIHTMSCKALKTASFQSLMEAHRQGTQPNTYIVVIVLRMPHQYGNLVNIMTIFSELRITISHISVENLHNGMSEVALESEYNNPTKIAFLLKDLKKYSDSIEVVRRQVK